MVSCCVGGVQNRGPGNEHLLCAGKMYIACTKIFMLSGQVL